MVLNKLSTEVFGLNIFLFGNIYRYNDNTHIWKKLRIVSKAQGLYRYSPETEVFMFLYRNKLITGKLPENVFYFYNFAWL